MWRVLIVEDDPAIARVLQDNLAFEGFVALNDTDWGARGGFDQLRTFVGAELPLPGRQMFTGIIRDISTRKTLERAHQLVDLLGNGIGGHPGRLERKPPLVPRASLLRGSTSCPMHRRPS